MDDADRLDNSIPSRERMTAEPLKGLMDLKPKGACWYCNQPLDNVRKFCNKTCADDYRTEEAFSSLLK